MAKLNNLRAKNLPAKGEPGSLYFAGDARGCKLFIAAVDGTLCPADGLFNITVQSAGLDGAAGERGQQGEKGERGERGPQGEQGTPGERGGTGPRGFDGKDGERGEPGPQGAPGRDGQITVTLVQENLDRISALEFAVAALLDQNAKGKQYVAWLKAQLEAKHQ
jgi:hypothetical protein